MKTILRSLLIVLALLAGVQQAAAQGTAFTYQGRLSNAGGPANGTYDVTYKLWNALSGGAQVGSTVTNSGTVISNGLFTATIDFGAVFNGSSCWLELGVRTNGAASFTTLTPREAVTPTPYAITAENVDGPVPAIQLSGTIPSSALAGTYGNGLNLNNAGNNFIGNGAGLIGVNAALLGGLAANKFWQLGGNAGTTPGLNYLGTPDNQALQFKVNNTIALQFSPGVTVPNIVGGLAAIQPSIIASGVSGAVIAGGNAPSGIVTGFGVGDFQSVYDDDGTIGGGFGNHVGTDNGDVTDAAFATVAGGVFNSASGYAATVGGGDANQSGGSRSVVAGGYDNIIQLGSDFSTIGGGYANIIQSNSAYSTIGGGYYNIIQSNSVASTIGGGFYNQATNSLATVLGGYYSVAGGYLSFAAGYGARAFHPSAFVYSDQSGGYFDSTTNNEFSIRAQNGVRIQSDVGIHLNAGDLPLIVRDWDVFATNAPAYKAGIGRWGLFMEPNTLTIGIPSNDIAPRYFQVAKYNTNGTPTTLMQVDQAGNVSANSASLNSATITTATVNGNIRITGLIRSGSETGTGQPPSPAGLVIRRINSSNVTSNEVVAVNSVFKLVRDGTSAGFQITYPGGFAHMTIACMGIDATGAQKNFYTTLNSAAAATVQIYSNAQNIVHFECTFGDPYSFADMTQVTLTRENFDYYWVGTVNSTYNQ